MPDESKLEQAKEKGKKLGFLIASMNLHDKEKEALLSLLPQMTEQQLNEFIHILEANFLNAATQDADKQLASQLEEINQKYDNKVEEANAQATEELDKFDKGK